jgi:hypothetical protein
MDVSVIYTQKTYFSSDFERLFLMNSLGKSLLEICIVYYVTITVF